MATSNKKKDNSPFDFLGAIKDIIKKKGYVDRAVDKADPPKRKK